MAAGASRRLGQPKQLVQINGRSLLEAAIRTASESTRADHMIFLGASAQEIIASLELHPENYQLVKEWHLGFGHTLATAAKYASHLGYKGLLVCLCDQLHISTDILTQIIDQGSEGYHIVNCLYANGASGPPCYFDQSYFPLLQKLTGDQGAKEIISNAALDARCQIEFPLGHIDIDTPEDLLNAKNQ